MVKSQYQIMKNEVARLAGLEPTTLCLEGRCSIQLSYKRDWLGFGYRFEKCADVSRSRPL